MGPYFEGPGGCSCGICRGGVNRFRYFYLGLRTFRAFPFRVSRMELSQKLLLLIQLDFRPLFYLFLICCSSSSSNLSSCRTPSPTPTATASLVLVMCSKNTSKENRNCASARRDLR